MMVIGGNIHLSDLLKRFRMFDWCTGAILKMSNLELN